MWILHCDSHAEFSESFRYLMEARDHVVVASIGTPREIEAVLGRDPAMASGIDVIVTELFGAPRRAPLDEFARHVPKTPVVVLTGEESPEKLSQAEAGGIVLKAEGFAALEGMIRSVLQGPGRGGTPVRSAGVRALTSNGD